MRIFLLLSLIVLSACSGVDTRSPAPPEEVISEPPIVPVTVADEPLIIQEETPDIDTTPPDPCVPNPCTAPNRNQCIAKNTAFSCTCNEGFRDIAGICTKKQVLVLSVGAERGLAHIGAIDALKAQGLQFDAVFGNSMGSLIGSFYAVSPRQDIASRYRELMSEYVKESSVTSILVNTIKGKDVIAKVSNQRFERVLNTYFHNIKLEETAIPFATSYFKNENGHLNFFPALNGNLAAHVSGSINHPGIFTGKPLSETEKIDPGLDRMSAIPVDQACKVFGPAYLIVVNVTTDNILYTPTMQCQFREIKIPPAANINIEQAMMGASPDFDILYKLGYNAVTAALKKP